MILCDHPWFMSDECPYVPDDEEHQVTEFPSVTSGHQVTEDPSETSGHRTESVQEHQVTEYPSITSGHRTVSVQDKSRNTRSQSIPVLLPVTGLWLSLK